MAHPGTGRHLPRDVARDVRTGALRRQRPPPPLRVPPRRGGRPVRVVVPCLLSDGNALPPRRHDAAHEPRRGNAPPELAVRAVVKSPPRPVRPPREGSVLLRPDRGRRPLPRALSLPRAEPGSRRDLPASG